MMSIPSIEAEVEFYPEGAGRPCKTVCETLLFIPHSHSFVSTLDIKFQHIVV
jgi:hypothetical protein